MLKLGVEVAACKKDGDFAKALEFVLPYEKFCCQLAEKAESVELVRCGIVRRLK